MKRLFGTGALVLAGTLAGCATGGPDTRYQDPMAVETVTTAFGSTDVQIIAEKMVRSLVESPIFGDERPVVWIYAVKNKTSEHVDTQLITDKIETTLLKSGKVRFTGAAEIGRELREQIDYQNAGGMVDLATAQRRMRQVGAKYALYGEIASIVKENGRSRLIDYHITMKLTNVETGLLEWSDDQSIRKGSTRRLLGR